MEKDRGSALSFGVEARLIGQTKTRAQFVRIVPATTTLDRGNATSSGTYASILETMTRSMESILLVLSLLLCVGCGNKEQQSPEGTSAADMKPQVSEPVQADTQDQAGTPATPVGARLADTMRPQKTQLGWTATSMRFIGWTKDSKAFALRTSYAVSDWQQEGAALPLMHVFELRDALTGLVLRSYQDEAQGEKHPGKYSDAWLEAKPAAQWQIWRDANPLSPITKPMPEGWTLVSSVEEGTVASSDHFVAADKTDFIALAWTIRARKPHAKRPKVIANVRDKRNNQRTLLQYRMPYVERNFHKQIGVVGEARMAGIMKPYWSPDEKKAVWVNNTEIKADSGVFPDPVASFFVRSLGPQVKLVDAGRGERATRKIAQELGSKGIDVTVMEQAETPAKESLVYFRGHEGGAANEVAAKLGSIGVEELTKPGWIDIIVVLGPETGPDGPLMQRATQFPGNYVNQTLATHIRDIADHQARDAALKLIFAVVDQDQTAFLSMIPKDGLKITDGEFGRAGFERDPKSTKVLSLAQLAKAKDYAGIFPEGEMLGERSAESWNVTQAGDHLHVSANGAYHMARLERAATGWSLAEVVRWEPMD